ncbi:hypothetical protein IW261DRAFT_19658 [Armillaria novae-zelandiae]|uniref:Uncharacterized protein n=1 Tax=Armillaria novae-zelandiae TaxID=153914 RepID=A0AA39UJP0_9AGAR|nr:hypothetical protein IW261DRAFT_19658 [Armillaria novae-zelandiae]
MPDVTVEHLANWVDLIIATRHENPANMHVFYLPPVTAAAANVWMFRKRERPEMNELVSVFPRVTAAGIPTSFVFAAKEYFPFYNVKDCEAEISSVDNVAGIIEILYKSRRACRALADELEKRKDYPVNVFLPSNHDIDVAREYRVFVSLSESVLRVSAIL